MPEQSDLIGEKVLPLSASTPVPDMDAWKPVLNLPCQVSFSLPIPCFTLGDLMNLRIGSVIDTKQLEGTDVEVLLNNLLIGWAEFEASGQQIAFRFTELAG